MLHLFLITIVIATSIMGRAHHTKFTLPDDKGHFTKIIIPKPTDRVADTLFVGGKNVLLRLDSDLNMSQEQIIGPVNNSVQCQPFDISCIYENYETVDNYVSILVPYKDSILMCGSANQGLCFRYSQNDIASKIRFKLININYLGSRNSSVMLASKSEQNRDIFFLGQSYDGRKQNYFYSEFVTLDLNTYHNEWEFERHAAASNLSVCPTKRNNFHIKFMYIFEADRYIFHIFMRSVNVSGRVSYETRISRFCKHTTNRFDYDSYEEMPISCQNLLSRFDLALSALFDDGKLYMTFGVRDNRHGIFQTDETLGSVLCVYSLRNIKDTFTNDVLSKCYKRNPNYGTPSWQCDHNIKSCQRDYDRNGQVRLIEEFNCQPYNRQKACSTKSYTKITITSEK